MAALILYEYQFSESIRTMLRLEHLFNRMAQLVPRDAAVDHHYALATLFEIMDVASRADLKSDLLKDLERQKALLNGYRGNPAISERVLDEVIGRIDHAFDRLNHLPGKAGQKELQNLVNLLGIPSSLNFAVMGSVILIGVLADTQFAEFRKRHLSPRT